ncbi:hypothetical protein C8A03DRAFT_14585 [Achaetomium macrosporum]|uniref:Uncharacterized protein n=1 Tax=Achaetomium macrosporum TaxID=79813 RepID=A0AAN7CD17_9PEZI|nr:hypothetical protein C8A03DRAFT_14585 [Achaetomium macrosporum]
MSAPTAVHGGTAPLAALTSVFTPPCSPTWLLTATSLPSQYPAFPTTGPTSCDPPSWRTNIARAGFHYYSPAICPRGFVVGPSCGLTKTRTAEGFPAVASGETVVYCVPIGLTCTTDTSDFRGGVWGFARDATTFGALVTVGPALQIRWVEADLTMLETHPLTPGLKLARTESGSKATAVSSARAITKGPETRPTASSSSTATLITDTDTGPENSLTLIWGTPDPTASLGASNTASSNSDGRGGLGKLDRGTSIVVIVVVTVVAGIALWTAAFLLIRRYKRRAGKRNGRSRKKGDEAGPDQGGRDTKANSGIPKSTASPDSTPELDSGSPAIGSTPNPAELEGDMLIQPPVKPWVNQTSWLKAPSQYRPQQSPTHLAKSTRRTVRESFGEKVNDPAAALGRLKIPNPLSAGRPSPHSPSPRAGNFWRLARSPRSPSAAAGGSLSAQLPKPSPRSVPSGNASRASTPGRAQPGWQDGSESTQRDALP